MKSTTRTGIYLALMTAVVSGVSIYLNKFAVKAVSDVVVFTTLKNTLVGLALIAYLIAMRRRGGLKVSRNSAWPLLGLALIGGSVPFLLFFKGLAVVSAPSAALIHKSLFLWVALLAVPLLGEQLGLWTVAGLGLLAMGQLMSGWPNGWGWGQGETLILLATVLWSGETILVKRLLPTLSTASAAAARMAGGAAVMWLYLLATGNAGGALILTANQWLWVVLTSILLLAYVTTWYAALKRAPASAVTSALTVGAVITAGLTLALEGKGLNGGQALGLGLMVVGVVFVIGLGLGQRKNVSIAAA